MNLANSQVHGFLKAGGLKYGCGDLTSLDFNEFVPSPSDFHAFNN